MSLLGRLSEHLENVGQSASSVESIIAMEGFISMLSLCSDGSLSQEMSVFSMWMDITPILSEVTRLRERATTMQSRRATLWREALNNPTTDVELRWIEMAESGLRSSWLRLERSFLRHARVWLRGHFFAPLPLLVAMPTGSTDQFPNRTDLLRDYNSSRMDFLSSLSSWRECMAAVEEVSAFLLILCLGLVGQERCL